MAEDSNKNKQGQINIELDEKVAEGIYSNLAIINHSVSEFVIAFWYTGHNTNKINNKF